MTVVSHAVALIVDAGDVATLGLPSGELTETVTIPPTTVAMGADIVTAGGVASTVTEKSAVVSPPA